MHRPCDRSHLHNLIEPIISDAALQALKIPGSVLLRTAVHRDVRGFFYESWREGNGASDGVPGHFVQDNVSVSLRNVIRGLHLQHPRSQGKLIQVVVGKIWDVSVDVRRGSPAFGQWLGVMLQEGDGQQVYVPPGVAHGFVVLSDLAAVSYKCTEFYEPAGELTIRWNDPALAIEWPQHDPILSAKDRAAPLLSEIDPERLPVFGEE